MKIYYITLYKEKKWKLISVDFYKWRVISYLHYRFNEISFREKLNNDGYILLWREAYYPIEYYIKQAKDMNKRKIEKLQNFSNKELLREYYYTNI